jgi:DNA polymerase-4
MNVARRIKAEIKKTTGLTASAGVAPNKFLAKIASAWRKPDGLTVIAPERMESFLQKLPVDALWGVGPVTAARLREFGITQLIDVRRADPATLEEAVGGLAEWLIELANGRDDREVTPDREAKSSSSEETYSHDLVDIAVMQEEIDGMARENAKWLEESGLLAKTVTIKVRYSDFTTVTRSNSGPPTNNADLIAKRAVALLDKTDARKRPVRLLGAGVHGLVNPEEIEDDEDPRLPFDVVEP